MRTRMIAVTAILLLAAAIGGLFVAKSYAQDSDTVFLPVIQSGNMQEVSQDNHQQSYSLADQPFEWAPQTNLLLYRQLNSSPTGPGGAPYDLSLFDTDNQISHRLSVNNNVWRPSFSADGRSILYWENGVPHWARVVRTDDIVSEAIQLEKPIAKGEFSPDGSQLFYITPNGEVRFHQINNGMERSIGLISILAQSHTLWPEWSPDGQYIAFMFDDHIGLLPANASSVDELKIIDEVIEPQGESSPDMHYLRWSADSTTLFIYQGDSISIRPNNGAELYIPESVSHDGRFSIKILANELYITDTLTGQQTQLTDNQASISLRSNIEPNWANIATIITDGFDFPVGKPDGEGYGLNGGYDFLDWTGTVYHPGEDWNGDGCGDCDLGDPVYAIANGTVIDSNYYPVWGNVILLEHTLPNGSKIWSQYAHLQNRQTSAGEVVNRGEKIGTIGKGDANYVAHLHFEIRIQYRNADFWPTGWSQSQILQYYTDPTNYIVAHRPDSGGSYDCENPDPENNQVVIFRGIDFDQGSGCKALQINQDISFEEGDPYYGKLSSIKIGNTVMAVLYFNPDYTRGGKPIIQNTGNLGIWSIAKSIRVRHRFDVNLDTLTNISDLLQVIKYVFRVTTADNNAESEYEDILYDLDENGKVDLQDVLTIIKYLFQVSSAMDPSAQAASSAEPDSSVYSLVHTMSASSIGALHDIIIKGDRLYAVNFPDTVRSVDISQVDNPILLDTLTTAEQAMAGTSISIFGDTIAFVQPYVGHVYGRVVLIEASESGELTERGSFNLGREGILEPPIHIPMDADFLEIDGLLYVARYDDGVLAFNVSDPDAPFEVGGYPTGTGATRIEIARPLIYFLDETGLTILRILGHNFDGNTIIGVDLGIYGAYSGLQQPTDIALDDQIAYLMNKDGEVHIVDISSPSAPQLQSILSLDVQASTVAVDDDRLLIGTYDGEIFVYDVSQPTNPIFIEQFVLPGSIKDIVKDGDMLFVAAGDGGLHILQRVEEAPGDVYEPDDTSTLATMIENGESQAHSIVPATDEDWMRFSLDANSAIVLETSGPAGDTVMDLYDSNLTLIEENDDSNGLFSRIERTCEENPLPAGTYYVKVAEYSGNATIDSYTLHFTNNTCSGQTEPDEYVLNVSTSGNGRVEISPEKSVYADGESVTLTAVADSGWRFDRWTGDASGTNAQITVIMDSDKNVTANFAAVSQPDEYTLNTSVVGSGSIEINPEKSVYADGESVTLTAVADSGWRFDRWTSDASGTDAQIAVIMDSDKSVTANFVTNDLPPHEPDDSPGEASQIQAGETQERSIDPVGDEDWIKLSLNVNSAVVLETSGPAGDTVMQLYNSNLNLIEENDDSNGMFSKIDRTCSFDPLSPGDYYVKVAEYGDDDTIGQYFITYVATTCSTTPTQQNERLFLPLIRK